VAASLDILGGRSRARPSLKSLHSRFSSARFNQIYQIHCAALAGNGFLMNTISIVTKMNFKIKVKVLDCVPLAKWLRLAKLDTALGDCHNCQFSGEGIS
jgi:hypothetical protein